jgi:hypothetical protein
LAQLSSDSTLGGYSLWHGGNLTLSSTPGSGAATALTLTGGTMTGALTLNGGATLGSSQTFTNNGTISGGQVLSLTKLTTTNNTLDDSSGNAIIKGNITLSTTPYIIFKNTGGTGAPTNASKSSGLKINLWDDNSYNYGLGIDSGTTWMSGNQYIKLYTFPSGVPTVALQINNKVVTTVNNTLEDGSGNMTVAGTITVNSQVIAKAESRFSTGTYMDPYNGTSQAIKASGGIATDTLRATGVITSVVATGTAPLSITSTTKVTNLNVDEVDGYHADPGTTVNTIPVRNSSGQVPGDITGNAATASNASKVNGITITVSQTAPSNPSPNDIWIV